MRHSAVRRIILKKDILLFRLSFAAFIISALSLLLSFFGSYKTGNALQIMFAVITGVLFWGGLAAAILTFVMVNSHRKAYEKKHREKKKKNNNLNIGVLSFFSNKEAKIADLIMMILILILLVIMFIPAVGLDIKVAMGSLILASVYAHSMLNGINYRYIKSLLNQRSVD